MPIVVLIGSLLGIISCTQPSESDGCSIDQFRISARSQTENCPRVWLYDDKGMCFTLLLCSVGKLLLDKKFIVLHL